MRDLSRPSVTYLFLLIEPIWNRNSAILTISLYCEYAPPLLIEPIWNRNIIRLSWRSFFIIPFNRTNLE